MDGVRRECAEREVFRVVTGIASATCAQPHGGRPVALAFWQDAVPGGRSWDGETVVRGDFRGVLGLSEERSWSEIFSSEKAGCPFRRSETRLFAEFAAIRHPCGERFIDPRCFAKTLSIAHSADQCSAARQEPRHPRSSPVFSKNFREAQCHWASARPLRCVHLWCEMQLWASRRALRRRGGKVAMLAEFSYLPRQADNRRIVCDTSAGHFSGNLS
jgi:hypothetical protein